MRGGRARYEEFWALGDVSFEVPEGSTFGLIGENGSGKCTLLKCIARILRPDTGIDHRDGKLSALLELGAGFHPELSGRENVYLNGSILGLSQEAARRAVRRHRRLRRHRAVHRHAGEELLLRHVRAARLLGRDQRRSRHPARRRGARGRRRGVPAQVHGEVRRLPRARARRSCSCPTPSLGARHCATRSRLLEHGTLVDVGAPGQIIDDYLGEALSDSAHDGRPGAMGLGRGPDRAGRAARRDRAADHSSPHRVTRSPLASLVAHEPVERAGVRPRGAHDQGHRSHRPERRGTPISSRRRRRHRVVDFTCPGCCSCPATYDLSAVVYDFTCSTRTTTSRTRCVSRSKQEPRTRRTASSRSGESGRVPRCA